MTPDDLMFRPGLMSGQRILVTWAAAPALAGVMAEALPDAGRRDLHLPPAAGVLEETAKELTGAHGGRMVPIACDIRVPEDIARHARSGLSPTASAHGPDQ